jgi:hypothetical protein
MLGIAGAYVLRAVAESGSFPKLAVVVLALAYAGTWLIWAVRVPVGARFASSAYAVTAALILAPMLAELTLRFRVLPSPITAGLLALFVIASAALAWKRRLTPVVWVAGLTGVLTALALLIASRDLVPYLAALLLMALACEFAAACNRWGSLRAVVAIGADVGVFVLLNVYSLPPNTRTEYTPVSPAAALALPSFLFLICGTSIAFRTASRRERMTIFEIVQAVISFLLAGFAWLRFPSGAGLTGFGIGCWIFSAACYIVAFARCDRVTDKRNYHVYVTWGAALVLAGCFIVLSPPLATVFLSVASIAVTLLGVRLVRVSLEFQGLAFLAAAALTSGLWEFAGSALAGNLPSAPGWMACVAAVSALVGYAINGRLSGERWNQRLLRLLSAILASGATAAFLIFAVVPRAANGITPDAAHVAVIRTLIVCAFALALAFGGGRWRRTELTWSAYGALALVTAKLLLEDLPHGHSGSIAISIFLYAVALIAVPRVARASRQQKVSE